jgi:hypothetical protein
VLSNPVLTGESCIEDAVREQRAISCADEMHLISGSSMVKTIGS